MVLENPEDVKLLLTDSSSLSDIAEVVMPKPIPKRKVRRKFRVQQSRTTQISSNDEEICKCCNRFRNISKWLSMLILICWITILTSITFVLYEQVHKLNSDVKLAVASSQGVPDELQKCHSISKNLQQNQTNLSIEIQNLKSQLENFNKQVLEIKNGLNDVQEKLKENPDLVNIPRNLDALTSQVAQSGSQVQDLRTTVDTIKEQNKQFVLKNDEIVQNLTKIELLLKDLKNSSSHAVSLNESHYNDTKIDKLLTQINANITKINETLSVKLNTLRQDLDNDHKLLDNLQEINQTVILRLSALEKLCSKYDATETNIMSLFTNLSSQVAESSDRIKTLELTLKQSLKPLPSTFLAQSLNKPSLIEHLNSSSNIMKRSTTTFAPTNNLQLVKKPETLSSK